MSPFVSPLLSAFAAGVNASAGASGTSALFTSLSQGLQAAFDINPSQLAQFVPSMGDAFNFIGVEWSKMKQKIRQSVIKVAGQVTGNIRLQQIVLSHGLTGKKVGLVVNLPSPPRPTPWGGIRAIHIALPKGFDFYLRSANEQGRLFGIEARAGGKRNPTYINIVRYDYQDFEGGTYGFLPHYHIADDPDHYSL